MNHHLRLSPAGAVVLGLRLLRTNDIPSLRDATLRLQALARERDRLRPMRLSPLDQRLEGAWLGLRARLEGWVWLGHREAHSAKLAIEALFPPSPVTYDHEGLRRESEARLARLKSIEADIVRLAGIPFLTGVRAAHEDFAAAFAGFDEELSRAINEVARSLAEHAIDPAGSEDGDPLAAVP